MQSFEGFRQEKNTKKEAEKYIWFKIEIDDLVLVILIAKDETVQLLTEAQYRGKPLGGPYSALEHKPPYGKNHIHVYLRNNEIFALNSDGTAHDGYHGIPIPKRVANAIPTFFPSYQLPPKNLIENFDIPIAPKEIDTFFRRILLLENNG